MLLSREEKILVLLFRVQEERANTLLGAYDSYDIGEKKIRKLKAKIKKLGGDPDLDIILS